MRDNPNEYQIGYVNGFYAALRATEFVASLEGTTREEILEGTREVLAEMQADGDLEYIRSGIDGLIEAAQAAEDAGKSDEFIDFLENISDSKSNK